MDMLGSGHPHRALLARFWLLWVATLWLFGEALGARAQSGGDLGSEAALIELLEGSRDFRVRVRAALALGNRGNRGAAPALARALGDPHPAVRAAACDALSRIGGPLQLPALRARQQDPEASVRQAAERAIAAIEAKIATASPSPPASPPPAFPSPPPALPSSFHVPPWHLVRAVVVMGSSSDRSPQNQAAFLASALREELATLSRTLTQVRFFEAPPQAGEEREISRKGVQRYRIDASIQRLERVEGPGIRCEVSLLLLEDPTANLRAAFRGAATVIEPPPPRSSPQAHEQKLVELAIRSATRSASLQLARFFPKR